MLDTDRLSIYPSLPYFALYVNIRVYHLRCNSTILGNIILPSLDNYKEETFFHNHMRMLSLYCNSLCTNCFRVFCCILSVYYLSSVFCKLGILHALFCSFLIYSFIAYIISELNDLLLSFASNFMVQCISSGIRIVMFIMVVLYNHIEDKSMARASIYTLLALDRYSAIMGIAPLPFNTGATPSLSPAIFPQSGCNNTWWQYDWQSFDQVSREQLAGEIAQAERDIAGVIGYWPAPIWIAQEEHAYPRPYLREAYGNAINVRGGIKSVATTYGRIISAGQRGLTLIGTATTAGATLVYTDADADGLYETATITLPCTYTNTNYIKAYFAGYSGEQVWEIRPARSVTIVGANVVMVFDAWMLIKPTLWDAYPTSAGMYPIDVSTINNYVTSVEVYYEFTDFAQYSAKFYYEPYPCPLCGSTDDTCTACSNSSQCGCFHMRDHKNGLVVPVPGTYSSTNGAWSSDGFIAGREPDIVKLWYRAGDMSNEYLRGVSHDPLSNAWAKVIAYMATARLERPLCGCANTIALSEYLRTDMAVHEQGGGTYMLSFSDLENPFGTHRGELYAWRYVQKRLPDGKRLGFAVI